MSLLSVIQRATNELGLPEPSTVVGNSDVTVRQMLAMMYRTGSELKHRVRWPFLIKEHTFTLVADQDAYALPVDMAKHVFETHWERDELWPLLGPLTASEWQARVSGVNTASPRRRYRVKTFQDKQFFVHPTPDSSEAGNTLVFEYISDEWFLPRTIASGNIYTANQYTYDPSVPGVYKTALGGTSDATTVAADTGVTDWTLRTDAYDTFMADTDQIVLDEDLIGLGVQWRFMRQKGLPYQHIFSDYEKRMRYVASAHKSAGTLSLSGGGRVNRFLSSNNVPDTNFGS